MKTLYTLLSFCLVTSLISAQNTVTFQVDMSDYTGAFTQVNLNGTFNEWCGACAVMTDDNSDDIWEIDVTDLPDGDLEYKFTLDGWTTQEIFTPGAPCTLTSGTFTNRLLTLAGDTILPAVCWENCTTCGGAPVSADVTFRVDMSEYTGDYTTVNLNGTFNNWCGTCAPMTDDDSDGIYEITTNLLVGTSEYKFTVDGWTGEEILTEGEPCTSTVDTFTNRFVDVTEEVILAPVCWESCDECAVGISESDFQANFSIAPNPSSDVFNISVSSNLVNPVQLSVFNMLGESITNSRRSIIGNITIDLSSEPVGIYFVKFDDGVNSFYKKIIRVK